MPQVPVNTASVFRTSHGGMFGALSINPDNLRFATQNASERVFIKARAHPLVNVNWVFNIAILIAAPIIAVVAFSFIPIDFDILDYIKLEYIVLAGLIYYSVVYTSALFSLMDWYYDIYLVTNERLLNIQFDPLKQHRIAEARLENIEHVSESVVGFLPQMFNYGNVEVQTAAKYNLFIFRAVPDPSWFRDVLVDLSRVVKKGYIRRDG